MVKTMKTKKINVVFNAEDLVKQMKKAKNGAEFLLYETTIDNLEDFRNFRKYFEELVVFQRANGYKINGVLSFKKVKQW
jgi:hypothetical protein